MASCFKSFDWFILIIRQCSIHFRTSIVNLWLISTFMAIAVIMNYKFINQKFSQIKSHLTYLTLPFCSSCLLVQPPWPSQSSSSSRNSFLWTAQLSSPASFPKPWELQGKQWVSLLPRFVPVFPAIRWKQDEKKSVKGLYIYIIL